MNKNKPNVEITPVTLVIVIVGIGLAFINGYFNWNIPFFPILVAGMIVAAVYYAQARK